MSVAMDAGYSGTSADANCGRYPSGLLGDLAQIEVFVRAPLLALGLLACSSGPAPDRTLRVVPDDIVTAKVRPLLPEGAVLARSVVQGDVGLGPDSLLVTWADREPRAFHVGVVDGGALHRFPDLHGADAPERVGAVMLVQADGDPAGEVVVLLDRGDKRPDRLLATAAQQFESVVVDHAEGGFVRVADWEAAVAGQSQPNEIRRLLEPGAKPL